MITLNSKPWKITESVVNYSQHKQKILKVIISCFFSEFQENQLQEVLLISYSEIVNFTAKARAATLLRKIFSDQLSEVSEVIKHIVVNFVL